MMSILGLLVKILKLLNDIYQQNGQILIGQQQAAQTATQIQNEVADVKTAVAEQQADIDVIKKVLGIGVPVSETIIFGSPKP